MRVTVKEPTVAETRTLHMLVGKNKNLSIKGVKVKSWSSASENIAAFVKKNKLQAKEAGETDLNAVTKDGKEYRGHVIVE